MIFPGAQVVGVHHVGVDVLLQLFHELVHFRIIGYAVDGNARVGRSPTPVHRHGISLRRGRNDVAHATPLVKNAAVQVDMRKFRKRFWLVCPGEDAAGSIDGLKW